MQDCMNTTILHAVLTKKKYGIYIVFSKNTILTNISITNLKKDGIDETVNVGVLMDRCNAISLTNILFVTSFVRTGLDFSKCSNVMLGHSTFSSLYSTATEKYLLESAIVTLKYTNMTLASCIFRENKITSILAVSSRITLHENLVFANNRALYGAVFILTKSSVLIVSESCTTTFQNNTAIDYGGVFYIVTEEFLIQSKTFSEVLTNTRHGTEFKSMTNCFIQVEGKRSRRMLTFTSNSAGKGGDVIFGGLVALGWDKSIMMNCWDSFQNMSDLAKQSTASLISSAPSRVCLCQDSQKDCLIVADPKTHTIYSGETITIPAVVVGQHFGTVTGSVIAQLMFPSGSSPTSDLHLKKEQSSVLFNNGPCMTLDYTFYTNCIDCKAVLVLKTDNAEVSHIMTTETNRKLKYFWNMKPGVTSVSEGYVKYFASSITACGIESYINIYRASVVFPKEIYHYPLYINITFRSCPTGFSLTALPPFKCDCNDVLKQIPEVKCIIHNQVISRVGSVWVGKYHNESVAVSNYCPLNYCSSDEMNITLIDVYRLCSTALHWCRHSV